MRRRYKVVAGAVATVVAAGALTLPGADASGDATVVVRGAALPAGARSQLNAVGCGSVFGRTSEAIVPTIGVVSGRPGDKRSLGFDLGGGNAVGSVSYVDRVSETIVAGMTVHADAGSTGVAYVGYQAPKDVGTNLMWIGRASLAVPADSWTAVNARGLGYAWTQYDMSTRQPIGGVVGSSGVPEFVQARGGDGPGFYMVGFGCDGNAFNTDAWRVGSSAGVTTYDFEGYTTRTSISGPGGPIERGAAATLTGAVVDGSGAPVAGRAVLEAKQGDGTWDTVDVAPGPHPSAVVHPDKTTTYRWKFFDRARYEGSVSGSFTVKVEDAAGATETADPDPSDAPSAKPSHQPQDQPSAPAASEAPDQAPAEQSAGSPAPPAETSPSEPAAEETQPAAEQTAEPTAPASESSTEAAEGTSG